MCNVSMFKEMRPFVLSVEDHSGDIEESSPFFQISESQWTEEDVLEKLNHERPNQNQGIQESVQPIEDGDRPKKQRIDSSLDSIFDPVTLCRGSGGRGEL